MVDFFQPTMVLRGINISSVFDSNIQNQVDLVSGFNKMCVCVW